MTQCVKNSVAYGGAGVNDHVVRLLANASAAVQHYHDAPHYTLATMTR